MNRVALVVALSVSFGCSKGSEGKGKSAAETSPGAEKPAAVEPATDEAATDEPAKPAGAPGSWAQVGSKAEWKATRLAVVIGNSMYSIERGEASIWKTDLATGKFSTIGKPDFGSSKFMLATADAIYTIERDGKLYRVDPNDGSWKQVGKTAEWGQTRLAVTLGNNMYSIERGEAKIWKTDLTTGKFETIGSPDFGSTKFMLATADAIYTIETDGKLFRVNPDDGSWKEVSPKPDWKDTRLAVTLGNNMYSIERGEGAMWKTNLATGSFATIGKPDFADTKRMVASDDAIYTIETDGKLYRVQP